MSERDLTTCHPQVSEADCSAQMLDESLKRRPPAWRGGGSLVVFPCYPLDVHVLDLHRKVTVSQSETSHAFRFEDSQLSREPGCSDVATHKGKGLDPELQRVRARAGDREGEMREIEVVIERRMMR